MAPSLSIRGLPTRSPVRIHVGCERGYAMRSDAAALAEIEADGARVRIIRPRQSRQVAPSPLPAGGSQRLIDMWLRYARLTKVRVKLCHATLYRRLVGARTCI